MKHKPNCSSKISCLVYHGEGVPCPGYKECDCGGEKPTISQNYVDSRTPEERESDDKAVTVVTTAVSTMHEQNLRYHPDPATQKKLQEEQDKHDGLVINPLEEEIEAFDDTNYNQIEAIKNFLRKSLPRFTRKVVEKADVGERKYVSQPAEYNGSDANVWRDGFNSARSQFLENIEKELSELEK